MSCCVCNGDAFMACGADLFCPAHMGSHPRDSQACDPVRYSVDGLFFKPLSETTVHDLETWSTPFKALWDGEKSCEVRKNDRGYQKGHLLNLREWVTGASMLVLVTHVQEGFGLPDGLVVMSVKVLKKTGRPS